MKKYIILFVLFIVTISCTPRKDIELEKKKDLDNTRGVFGFFLGDTITKFKPSQLKKFPLSDGDSVYHCTAMGIPKEYLGIKIKEMNVKFDHEIITRINIDFNDRLSYLHSFRDTITGLYGNSDRFKSNAYGYDVFGYEWEGRDIRVEVYRIDGDNNISIQSNKLDNEIYRRFYY